jgi:hypothetical protein
MTHVAAHPFVALLLLLPAQAPSDSAKTDTPLYTNADLDRVAPLRDQTGVASVPAVPPSEEAPRARRSRRRAGSEPPGSDPDETYWRREAARHRKRQDTLIAKVDGIQRQIAQEKRRRVHPLRSRDDSLVERLEQRCAEIERQRREEDDEFEERARRAGALPGWLR